MPVDAADTGAVKPEADTYASREANPELATCACVGVPAGQHIAACIHSRTPFALPCPDCELRTASVIIGDLLVCGGCGGVKKAGPGAS